MQKVRIRFAYKQGFRRIFFIIAALWLGFGIYADWGFEHFWRELLQVCVIPLAVIYLFGVICVWIIEGFVKADR
jgi:biotin transporter BioY